MPDRPFPTPARMADRLRASRTHRFVGRAAHLNEFRSALAGEPGAYAVCFVSGPGGIGKSSLLRRLKDIAEDDHRTVIEIDGRAVETSLAEFFMAAETAQTDDRTVVLVDTFERCQGVEEWLRDRFLPRVLTGVVVVVAGRRPPSTSWTSDEAWTDLLRVVQLDGLTPAESAALLEGRGVAPELRETVVAFAGGNPLALSLAADTAVRVGASWEDWKPTQDVIAPLVSQMVGDVPSEAHRSALTVLAQARVTTEPLLQQVLSQPIASRMFDWLMHQPYVEVGERGVYPHDVVRDVLEAHLRWRNQQRYADVYNEIWPHLLQVSRAAGESDVLPAIRDLTYLLFRDVEDRYFYKTRFEGYVHEAPMGPADRAEVLAFAAEVKGPLPADVLDFWLRRQPGCVRLYRSSKSNDLVACMVWVRLGPDDREAIERDPAAAAAWAHATGHSALQDHEHIGIGRYLVHPAAYHVVSAPIHLIQLRTVAEWVRAEGMAASYFALSNPDYWRELLEHLLHRPIPQDPETGSLDVALFGRNWEHFPLEFWFENRHSMSPTAPPVDGMHKLSRADFDAAVRHALGSWRNAGELGANPLARTRLVRHAPGAPPSEEDVAEALRGLLDEAVGALRDDPRAIKFYRAVTVTYRDGAPTQQVAARRLGLPFTTYRRHLTRGVDRMCELLWQRNLAR